MSCQVTRNLRLRGIEIRFPDGEPNADIKKKMSDAGFKESQKYANWWAKYTDSLHTFALELCGEHGADLNVENRENPNQRSRMITLASVSKYGVVPSNILAKELKEGKLEAASTQTPRPDDLYDSIPEKNWVWQEPKLTDYWIEDILKGNANRGSWTYQLQDDGIIHNYSQGVAFRYKRDVEGWDYNPQAEKEPYANPLAQSLLAVPYEYAQTSKLIGGNIVPMQSDFKNLTGDMAKGFAASEGTFIMVEDDIEFQAENGETWLFREVEKSTPSVPLPEKDSVLVLVKEFGFFPKGTKVKFNYENKGLYHVSVVGELPKVNLSVWGKTANYQEIRRVFFAEKEYFGVEILTPLVVAPTMSIYEVQEAAKAKAIASCPYVLAKEVPKSMIFALAYYDWDKREPEKPIEVTYYKKIKAWWYTHVENYAYWSDIIPMVSDEKLRERSGTNLGVGDGLDNYLYRALPSHYKDKDFYVVYNENAAVSSTPSVQNAKSNPFSDYLHIRFATRDESQIDKEELVKIKKLFNELSKLRTENAG